MSSRLLRYFFLLVVALFLPLPVPATELTIEIRHAVDNPIPVAVVPFGVSGATFVPEDIAQIIGNDLTRSGQFHAMSRDEMIASPTQASDVFYNDWRAAGSEWLLFGSVAKSGADTWTISFELHDVKREQRAAGQSVTATTAQLRDAAHFISDVVYEQVTGIKGVFSTKLLYVTVDRHRKNGKLVSLFGLQYADADGARTVTVLDSKEPIMSPTWSPDGKRFAYVSFETGRPAIYIQDRLTGKREKMQSFVGINGAPAWSPDGRYLALTLSRDGDPEIYLFDFTTSELKRMTRDPGIDTEPSWSPDGKWLAFTSSRSGGPQIYRLDIDSGNVQRLTFVGNYNARARVTPDGHGLVVVHGDEGNRDRFRIATYDLERNLVRNLTESWMDESPSLAPNGRMAVYATQENGRAVLAATSIDGRIRLQLPANGGEVREPAWSPTLH